MAHIIDGGFSNSGIFKKEFSFVHNRDIYTCENTWVGAKLTITTMNGQLQLHFENRDQFDTFVNCVERKRDYRENDDCTVTRPVFSYLFRTDDVAVGFRGNTHMIQKASVFSETLRNAECMALLAL